MTEILKDSMSNAPLSTVLISTKGRVGRRRGYLSVPKNDFVTLYATNSCIGHRNGLFTEFLGDVGWNHLLDSVFRSHSGTALRYTCRLARLTTTNITSHPRRTKTIGRKEVLPRTYSLVSLRTTYSLFSNKGFYLYPILSSIFFKESISFHILL